MSGNKKPVVLFLNHWARRLGGAEHSLLDLLAFAKNSFDCHLVSGEPGVLLEKASKLGVCCHIVHCAPSIEKIRRRNLTIHFFRSVNSIIVFFIYTIKLKKLITQIKPVLIHANVPKSHIALFLLSRIGYNARCCFHIREIFGRNSLASFLYKILFRSQNGSVIAISQSVKNNLPSNIQRYTTVIYNGVAVNQKQKEYSEEPTLKLLYIGRIVPWKGCHHLLDILSMVYTRYPNSKITLSLVGDTMYWSSDYRDELMKKIEYLNLSSCCYLSGYTDDSISVYMNHDIFCIASFQEPFGRVVAEAQGCGLPVIAFDTGAVSEIVKHEKSGLLVPYGDNKSFVNAIYRFISSPDLIKKMGNEGRRRVECYFDRNKQCPILCSYLGNKISLQNKLEDK